MSEKKHNSGHSDEIQYDELTNEPLTDHDYDGIKELDNDLPSWWRYLFYLTILFSIGYIMKYHVFKQGMLQDEEYLSQFPEYYEHDEDTTAKQKELVLLEPLTSAEDLNAGKEIFQLNCKVCHLADGGGDVGPNLTDNYWMHGGTYKEIVKLVSDGVPAKGMQSWKVMISKKSIEQVSSYIWTLNGTTPAKAKEPQGELYVRE